MERTIPSPWQIVVPIAIAIGGLLAALLVGYNLLNGDLTSWKISEHQQVNFAFTMQMMVLPVSFVALAATYLYDRNSFLKFFKPGFKTSPDWNAYGVVVALAFTAGTTMLMSFNVVSEHGKMNGKFFEFLPLVLVFAATNAWSEEIFSRFVLVAGLDGKLKPEVICLLSALIFGAAHYSFGTPNGLFGVVASGGLGWFLAKSVVDTKGLGWALLIHFLQDVVIFGAGAMILAGKE
jgi:uncharacterized protein